MKSLKYLFLLLIAVFVAGCSIQTKTQNKTNIDLSISYQCEANTNLLELLKKTHQVLTKETSFGPMITSINGQEAKDNKFWLYTIDNKEATVGAHEYICQGSEQIKWELK